MPPSENRMFVMVRDIGAKEIDKPAVYLIDIAVWLTVIAMAVYGAYLVVGWLISVWVPG